MRDAREEQRKKFWKDQYQQDNPNAIGRGGDNDRYPPQSQSHMSQMNNTGQDMPFPSPRYGYGQNGQNGQNLRDSATSLNGNGSVGSG